MKAEIIAVGSELLTPNHVDTNSLYLTEKLNETGYQVHLKTIVGDNERDIADILHSAIRRSNLIVFSGGLGPTEDDLTRTAVANVLNRPLILDSDLLEQLKRRFAQRGYRMSRNNERQAEVIERAEVLANAFGTAPGMWIEEQGRYIVLLPGPPREIKPMFDSQVLPRILQLGQSRKLVKRSLRIAGLTESEVDSRLSPIYTTYTKVQTTILAGGGHIAVHLHQWVEAGENPAEIEELAGRLREMLGDAIFTTSDEAIEQVVGNLLRDSGQNLAVAESCTSGMVGMRITRIPGSSEYFRGGVLCYANDVKQKVCGVSEELLQRHGAVSAEAAEALARGVREALQSSIGLSITGIAGPGGGTQEKPVGLVFVGVADAGRCLHARSVLPGDREVMRERASFFALAILRKFLLEIN
jgi:nicotinamide-nucleotide amidase